MDLTTVKLDTELVKYVLVSVSDTHITIPIGECPSYKTQLMEKLDEVYNSKNVILSEDFFHAKMSYQIHLNKSFNEFKGKNIFIKPKYIDFVKNYFEEKKLIGKKF